MRKQLLHTYWFVFICMLTAVIVLCFAAGYSVRVLDQNRVIQQVDVNMDAAKIRLDRDAEETASLMEDLRNEYASKTRVVAMLLGEQADLSENETILEELRVVIDAEQISVSNETGILVASTDFSSTGRRVQDSFLPHAMDSVFTDVLFTMQNDKPAIIAASSLGTGKGLVQVQYPSESMLTKSQEMDVSAIVLDMPFYDMGISAIVDAETGKYVSHTQPERCGNDCEYDMNLFSAKKGKFDLMQQHQRYFIRYQAHDNYILLFNIPYQQMNNVRGTVLNWVIATGLILLLVAVLSMRMGYIYLQKKSPNLFPKGKQNGEGEQILKNKM